MADYGREIASKNPFNPLAVAFFPRRETKREREREGGGLNWGRANVDHLSTCSSCFSKL